jgi:hypothetical protein
MKDVHSSDGLFSARGGWSFAACSSLVLFLLLAAAASFLSETRLWGVNHLAFYPVWVRVAALAAIVLAFLPRAARAADSIFDSFATALAGRRRFLAAIVTAAAALVLFIVFASATELLGDGLYTSNNIERASKVDRDVFVKVLKDPDPIYPGTEMLNLTVSRFALAKLGIPPLRTVRVMNALLGAILVFVVVAGARPPKSAPRGIGGQLTALMFLSGGIQIFFGYIEAYAPLMMFAGLYVWAAHRTLTRGASLWGPAVFAAAAAWMHLLGLLLVPSLVLLVFWVSFGRKFSSRFFHSSWILAAATAAGPFLVVDVAGLQRFFLPLTGGAYAALSIPHLADLVNQAFLLFPGLIVLGIAAAMVLTDTFGPALREKAGGVFEAFARVETENPLRTPRLFFAALLAIPFVLFLFFFKPELGVARDWDLFAITVVGPLVLVTTVLGIADAHTPAGRAVKRLLPPVLAMTAVLTAAWIGVNADPRRAAARFESILSYDTARAGYAYESLASLYKDSGDKTAEIRALEKAVEASPNPRYLFTLGLRYFHVGEREKAVATLDRCLRMRPKHDRARQSLVQMLYTMERYNEMLRVCEEGMRLDAEQGYYPFFMGKAYARTGRAAEARAALEKCRALDPPPEVVREIDEILRSLGDDGGAPVKGSNTEGTPQ